MLSVNTLYRQKLLSDYIEIIIKRGVTMYKKNIIISLLFLSCIFHKSIAIVKGSESVVSIEQHATFPAADTDNTIRGFGWFKNGFSLEDQTTTCTFDSVYPVSGNINLNSGTLFLNQDITFNNVTNILKLGTIVGNNHRIDLCNSINKLPVGITEFQNLVVQTHADLLLSGSLILRGNCKIIGNGSDIVIGDNGYIIIGTNTRAHFDNITIEGITADNFIVTDNTSEIILENVKWKQKDNFYFTQGNMLFLNNVDFIGSYAFTYDSNLTSTISNHSKLMITQGMCFKVGRKEASSNVEPLCFEDDTSILKLDSCEFIITSSGMRFTKGEIEVDRDVNLEILGTTTTTGLILGTGQEADDSIIHLNSGASLRFKTGQMVYNNYKNNKIEALSESTRIIRYGPSKFHVEKDACFPAMVLKVHSGIPITTVKDNAMLTYDNTRLVFGSFEYKCSGHQLGSYNFFLNGNDFINLYKGSFISPLSIIGSGNKICGTGSINSTIALQDSQADLEINLAGTVTKDIALNGGTCLLSGDLHLGSDATFLNSGTVDLSVYSCNLEGIDATWTSTILWESDGGTINLNSKINLAGTWLFNNSCLINGNGNTIDLSNGGEIILENGALVEFRNTKIQGISGNNIRCSDNNGILSLDTVTWLQIEDYIFSHGALKIKNDVKMEGAYNFCYQTKMTSTVFEGSCWKFNPDFIFHYAPESGAKNLIELSCDTSQIKCNDSFLHTATTGIQFTKGSITIKGECSFSSDILQLDDTIISEGVTIGNNLEADDCTLKLLFGSTLHVAQGGLTYNNISASSFAMESPLSVIKLYADTTLCVNQNIDLAGGELYLSEQSTATIAQGKNILGSVFIFD